jgi:tetratricopeptide (TPR) repeat protein
VTRATRAFTALVEAADAHQRAHEWEAAGGAWVEAARVAVDAGALPSARQALAAAGEAFRRDDRPGDAARALRLALGYGPDPAEAALLRVHLAGVCAELGEADEALALLALALDAAGPEVRPLVLDTRVGVVLGHRPKALARPDVDALEALGGAAAVAGRFRRGQLARLDGDLARARSLQQQVAAGLSGQAAAAAGAAAAQMELAELDLLQGRAVAALATLEQARRDHEGAGRRGLALRAEAARVRAAVEAGLRVHPGPVVSGLAFARDRGLPMLEVELQLAAGAALAGPDPAAAAEFLRAAVRGADARRAPLSAGRGRAALAALAPPGDERAALVALARQDLADHVPLLRRLDAL